MTVKEVTGDVPGNSSLREFVLDKPVAARFIRMTGTKLKLSGADGYLMQVGEIEAYGSPICNKTSLNEAITSAESASADNYSKEVFSSIQELVVKAKELSGSEYTTQTVADDMTCKILAALATTLPSSTPNRKAGVPATALASVTVNNVFTLDLSTIFEDADSDPLTYWVSVNGAPKVAADEDYSYTPAVAGLFTLTFTANDGTADSIDTYTVTLTVVDTPPTNPTIASITPVNNVEVPYGTEEAVALAALADTTTITDGGNSTHTVNLSWTIDGYDSNTAGDYTAAGTFTLPAGVEQSNPATLLEVTAIVTVRQAINAAISPTTVAFDPDSPGNVSTTVTWGSAAAVTSVV